MEEKEKPPLLTNFKSSVGSGIANASQLASKSSERSSLRSSLALDYLALGKELFASEQYQADLKEEHQQLQELSAKLSAVRQPVVQAGDTYLDQAKVMAIKAKRFAEEKILVHQLDKAFQRLGEAAYKKDGSLTGSEGLSKSIAEKLAKIESLDSEIAQASGQLKANFNSSVSSGGEVAKKFFSKRPNQIIAGVIAVCLVGFAVSKSGSGESTKTERSQVASTSPINDKNQNSAKSNDKTAVELKTYSVSKGLISGSITIEISKHEGVDLSSFTYKPSGIYMKITPDSTFGEEFIIGRDTYRYTSYDKDGVKLQSSFVEHEQIGPGESVQGVISIRDTATRVRIHH